MEKKLLWEDLDKEFINRIANLEVDALTRFNLHLTCSNFLYFVRKFVEENKTQSL